MILEANQFLYAPHRRQQMFWRQYNQKRRRRPVALGEVAMRLVSDNALSGAGRVRQMAEAWQAVVPREREGSTWVEDLSGGVLYVGVDSTSTKYLLSHLVGSSLLATLNKRLRTTRVWRISYRVGTRPTEAAQETSQVT